MKFRIVNTVKPCYYMYVRLIQALQTKKGEGICYQGFKKRTKKNKNETIK